MYNVKLTKAQLQALVKATDLLQRVQIGQWTRIEDHLPLNEPIDYRTMKKIGEMLSPSLKDNVTGLNSSLGIGHPEVSPDNHIVFDMHCTFRSYLAWEESINKGIVESMDSERKYPEMIGVSYDKPLKWGEEPLPVIERINDEQA
jgi:hypothetical protein